MIQIFAGHRPTKAAPSTPNEIWFYRSFARALGFYKDRNESDVVLAGRNLTKVNIYTIKVNGKGRTHVGELKLADERRHARMSPYFALETPYWATLRGLMPFPNTYSHRRLLYLALIAVYRNCTGSINSLESPD